MGDEGEANHEKFIKYMRNLGTERGVINCLARETPCKCMDGAKERAKSMAKVGFCHGCRKEFPKETMFLCSRCGGFNYCTGVCQRNHWPVHKTECNEYRNQRSIIENGKFSLRGDS